MSKSGKAGPEPGYRPSTTMRTAHGGSNAGNMLLPLCRAVLISALLVSVAGGCAATPDPVLYPNAHLKQVGQETAQRDTGECRQLAQQYGVDENREGNVAGNAAGGAANVGAAAGSVRGMMQASETSPVFRNFVQKCLRTGVTRSSAGGKHRPRA